MSILNFVKQFSTTAPGLLAIGISATLIVSGGYRFIIKPNMDRRRRLESESVAEFIYTRELRRNEN